MDGMCLLFFGGGDVKWFGI